MSEAQATPSRLHSYSKAMVAANREALDSVKRMAAAVSTYNRIRAKYINDPYYANTAGLHGTPEVPAWIVDDSQSNLAAVLSTDDWVGAVGSAFDRADGGAGPGGVVVTDETTLAHMLSEVNGANLAKLELTDPKLYQQLKAHNDDPWYLAGFFNGLSHDKLELLITDQVYRGTYYHGTWVPSGPIVAQALATAYSVNQFSKDFTKTLSEYYANSPRPGDKGPNAFWDGLLKDLAVNRDSALNFSRTLTKDSARNFLIQPLYVSQPMQTDLFRVLTVGAANMEVDDIKALLAAVTDKESLSPLTPKQFEELAPALRNFILASSYSLIGPVPKGLAPDDIKSWAEKAGLNLQALNGLATWAQAVEEGPRNSKEWMTGLGVTTAGETIVGIPIDIATDGLPLIAGLAVHLFGSAIVYSTEKIVTPAIVGAGPTPTAEQVWKKYIEYASEVQLANRVLAEGNIDPASRISREDLVKALMQTDSSNPRDSRWANGAHYENGDTSLSDLLSRLSNGLKEEPGDVDPKTLGGGG